MLGNLTPVEDSLNLDESYKEAGSFTPLPPKGTYTVQAPDSFPSSAFGATKAGFLSAQVDPRIVGGAHDGYTIRFTKVSFKPFKRSGVTVSQGGDYLRACGFRGRLSDPQSMADAVEGTANRIYRVDVDWRAYNKDTGYSLEGMERFPSDGNGGHLPWCEDPNAKDPETGEPVRLRANLQVTRYLQATN